MENKELLTGRCKAEFEQWYDLKYSWVEVCDCRGNDLIIMPFNDIPETMQQGVLLEYFETKGILFGLNVTLDEQYLFLIYHRGQSMHVDTGLMTPDYSTAFTTAIQKACEIINGKGE